MLTPSAFEKINEEVRMDDLRIARTQQVVYTPRVYVFIDNENIIISTSLSIAASDGNTVLSAKVNQHTLVLTCSSYQNNEPQILMVSTTIIELITIDLEQRV